MEDVRFKVQNWIEKSQRLTRLVWLHYSKKGKKFEVFSLGMIKKAEVLLSQYNHVLSWVTGFFMFGQFSKIGRLTQTNLPASIEKLQNAFIEAIWVAVYAIKLVELRKDSGVAGIDGIAFTTLVKRRRHYTSTTGGTRFIVSKKSLKVRKDLPKKIAIKLRRRDSLLLEVGRLNDYLRYSLLKKCNFRSLRKVYEAGSVNCLSILRKAGLGISLLDFFTVRDRVLQKIICLAMLPIIEYQGDALSFAFRKNKSVCQAVSFVDCQMKAILIKKKGFFEISAAYKKRADIIARWFSKSRRCQVPKKKRKFLFRRVFLKLVRLPFFNFFKIDLTKQFDSVSGKIVLELVPISTKYLVFLAAWLRASGANGFKRNIPRDSVIGPIVRNLVFDGLESSLCGSTQIVRYGLGGDNYTVTRNTMYCVRYAGEAFVLGYFNLASIQKLWQTLDIFLKSRNLSLSSATTLLSFKGALRRGSSLSYLGFRWVFPCATSYKFYRGRYTKLRYSGCNILFNKLALDYSRRLVMVLDENLFFRIKQRLRGLLVNRNNASWEISTILLNLNLFIWNTYRRFVISKSIRLQLKILDRIAFVGLFKLLQAKFRSKPKLKTFIMRTFYSEGRFFDGSFKQITIKSIALFSKLCKPFHSLRRKSVFHLDWN